MAVLAPTPLTATSTPGAGSVMPASQKELANFKERTERDARICPIFKSENHYDLFQRHSMPMQKLKGFYPSLTQIQAQLS